MTLVTVVVVEVEGYCGGSAWKVQSQVDSGQWNAGWYGVECNVMTGDRTVNNCCDSMFSFG